MSPSRKWQRLSEDDQSGPITVSGDQVGVASVVERPVRQAGNSKGRSLFVRSLPTTATTQALTEYFSQSYPLKHATVVVDPATKQSKGYGFVTFADAEDADRAKEEFNGKIFEGRKIKVEIAEPRHRQVGAGEDARGQGGSTQVSADTEAKAKRERRKQEISQSPKLIIRNLPWSIKKPEQLALLFRSYGKVKHATLPEKKPGLMAGFGFVVMRGRKNAQKALEGVNGLEVDGRTLAVDWAVEKEDWSGLQIEAANAEKGNGEEDGKVSEGLDEGSATEDKSEHQHVDDVAGSSQVVEDEDLSEGDIEVASEDNVDGKKRASSKAHDNASTLFVRNLPFTASDDLLQQHFSQFGAVRYARIVLDQGTERPKGTGFVAFFNPVDADRCLYQAPMFQSYSSHGSGAKKDDASVPLIKNSVLQNVDADTTGRYTMDGRVLQLSRAVNKSEAARLTEEGSALRSTRDKDKRRLYLLSEGTISSSSPIYSTLAPSEVKIREASAKQRRTLVQSNPTLHLSLTRLSIRNIPRSITSKDLKALAREAVVGFARDVKAGARKQLTKEELGRGGDEMREAERARKAKGKGIVKQAKIVFEGREGAKITEDSGAGRSRGYGFIEYFSHRWALMGLRWLNGHAVGRRATMELEKPLSKEDAADKKKRLIAEFAIENAQVVLRRQDREAKARERSKTIVDRRARGDLPEKSKQSPRKETATTITVKGTKRKRVFDASHSKNNEEDKASSTSNDGKARLIEQGKLAKRQQIIAKKRMMRRSRKMKGVT
ncbi:MAG: RNA recognition motif-containing protein [Candelina submexicana]|nr:MAG: RNA recognition motif-containing protein [Candelina submexicana]